MPMKLSYINGVPVEGPELDEEATKRRDELTELVLAEYEACGTTATKKVSEAVREFENYAIDHVLKD